MIRVREVQRLLDAASKDLAKRMARFKLRHPKYAGNFFKVNRALEKQIDSVLRGLNNGLFTAMEKGIENGWEIANEANDVVARSYMKGTGVSKGFRTSMMQPNLGAMGAFIDRIENGFTLSDRVWGLTQGIKGHIETYLGAGLAQGKSAVRLAGDLQTYLKRPQSAFRRVRNTKGRLVWSKPAKEYFADNPVGRGVYRSPYKNALRLARTETNKAFAASDFQRRQQLPFVVGVTVHLSGDHDEPDMCDGLAGDYPKGFYFTLWHPQGRCFTTSKKLSRSEFKEYLKTGKIDQRRYTRSVPQKAQRWLEKNRTRMLGWKNPPDWLQNFTKHMDLRQTGIQGVPLKTVPPVQAPGTGFVPAKTVKEAEVWAMQNLGVKNVDYNKAWDVKTCNEINRTIQSLNNKYGRGAVEALIQKDLGKGTLADHHIHVLRFSSNRFKDRKFIQHFRADGERNRFFVKTRGNRSVEAFTTHEYGHALFRYKYVLRGDKVVNEMTALYTKYVNAMEGGKAGGFISHYASTNATEFFAEVLTQAEMGYGLGGYAKEAMNIIEKYK